MFAHKIAIVVVCTWRIMAALAAEEEFTDYDIRPFGMVKMSDGQDGRHRLDSTARRSLS